MSEQSPINPSDLFLMHSKNKRRPALAVDDIVEYDSSDEDTCKSVDVFKSYLDRYYTYKLIHGKEYPQASYATYRIISIKEEQDWPL